MGITWVTAALVTSGKDTYIAGSIACEADETGNTERETNGINETPGSEHS